MKTAAFLVSLLFILSACVNDLDNIKKVTVSNTDPDERVKNLELLMTEDGYAKVKVFAGLAETYRQPKEITKLKNGINVQFFNEKGKIETTLTGKYGELYPEEGTMWIKNDVTLTNIHLKQVLKTEELFWNQKDSTIFTERLVTIISPQGKFYGDGIRSKQDFSSYEFIHPRGKLSND